MSSLHAKYVPVSGLCPVCKGDEETVLHAIVLCPFATRCWKMRGRVCQSGNIACFADWLSQMFSQTKSEEYAEIVTLCWALWNARNSLVWNQKKASVIAVVSSMKQYLADWKNAQLSTTKALYQFVEHGDGAQVWVKPQNDEVKITVDAATFARTASYGIGILARNKDGKVLLGRSEVYRGDVRPDFAEAIAVKEALSWCKENKWQKIILESDCLSVVQALRSEVAMISPFGQIIMECRSLIKDLNIVLLFIRRSANMAAHTLARESCSFPGRVFNGRSVPVNLQSILLDDLRI